MTSYPKCRYALWNHASTQMNSAITWRETPKSKAYVAVVPPTVLPGIVRVLEASADKITVQLTSSEQHDALKLWTSNVPSHVLAPSVYENSILRHSGPYAVLDAAYKHCDVRACAGKSARVRLTAEIQRIGPMRKTQINIVDVLCCNVTR